MRVIALRGVPHKARVAVGLGLSTLLKYNLIKGSLAAGSGVFRHDIIRDFVISEHSAEELHTLQRSVVDVILAARPEGGFPDSGFSSASSFVGYASRQLFWHFRGALREGDNPPDAWIAHPDRIVLGNVTLAVGLDVMRALSGSRETKGELVRAAELSWAASMMKGLPQTTLNDLIHRAADLLERADDREVLALELEVLSMAFKAEMGSPRHLKASNRQRLLAESSKATFESKYSEGLANFNAAMVKDGLFGGESNVEAAVEAMRESVRCCVEAGNLSDNPSLVKFLTKVFPAHGLGFLCAVASSHESWNVDDLSGGEADLVEGESLL